MAAVEEADFRAAGFLLMGVVIKSPATLGSLGGNRTSQQRKGATEGKAECGVREGQNPDEQGQKPLKYLERNHAEGLRSLTTALSESSLELSVLAF